MSKNPINITKESPPNLIGSPDIQLSKNDFDSVVWKKGYRVYHDKLINCPCKSEEGLFTTTCINCGGTGYVLVQRNETKMILQGMNQETKYKEWSEEKMGLVKITALPTQVLTIMDRIILLDAETTFNQVVYPKKRGKDTFALLFYEPLKVLNILMFDGANRLLKKLTDADYELQSNVIFLKKDFGNDLRVSINYSYRPQYHIIDTQRDLMLSDTRGTDLIVVEGAQFPISAMGRKSHYVLDRHNYNLTNLDKIDIENDYNKDQSKCD